MLLGRDVPVHFRCWDGSEAGNADARVRVVVSSPRALRRILWAPGELGLSRAYVAGEADFEGSVFDLLALRDATDPGRLDRGMRPPPRLWPQLAAALARLGGVGPPPPPPPEEARLEGRIHSRGRDHRAVTHHYDVGNDFYRLVLGPSLTYSSAYYRRPDDPLATAQEAKHELVCAKLGLGPGTRLLDIGCGWGSLAMHAAARHHATVVGVTISDRQAELARHRVAEAGLADRVEIRLLDYRDVDDGGFDAVSSVGMFEHVGAEEMAGYVGRVASLVRPGGRVLHHAITRAAGQGPPAGDSFGVRYVFPDSHLVELGRVISTYQDAGLECRHAESLREHYALTLRAWVVNLERQWEAAVEAVGQPRAKVWRLYMAGAALAFEAGRLNVHQVLLAKPDGGSSGFPLSGWGSVAAGPR